MSSRHMTDARRAKSMQEELLEKKTTKEKVHTVLHCLDDVRCMRLQEDLSLQDTTTNFEFKAVKHYLIWA